MRSQLHFLTVSPAFVLAALTAASLLSQAALAQPPCQPFWQEGFSPPGLNGEVRAIAEFDDGGGPAVYVAGKFVAADGDSTKRIAKWDGSHWSPLGSGIDEGAVYAMTVFDDGSGAALYVAGDFDIAGGVEAINIARWDGSAWSAVGSGTDSPILALTVFDDGDGPALYAAGEFAIAGGVSVNCIGRWDGGVWTPLGSGMDGVVRALTVFDDGSGPGLYAAGDFGMAGGVHVNCVAKWNGSAWSEVASGIWGDGHALAVFDDGGGPALYVGGLLSTADGAVSNIARLSGGGWSPLGDGTTGVVLTLAAFDDGFGPALFAGGEFTSAGGVAANRVARWDGSAWSPLGDGTNGSAVFALAVCDDGSGESLCVGGSFKIADDVVARQIAKWNKGSWSRMSAGNGILGGPRQFDSVTALTVFDDGGGPALYAAGDFNLAGGASALRIARWDGRNWSPLGSGIDGGSYLNLRVLSLISFDDGSGPSVYAGGVFDTAGGIETPAIARWDGSAWWPLGNGLEGGIDDMLVFDDGTGPALYAAGDLRINTGRKTPESVVRWDGGEWSVVGDGISGWVHALAVVDDERGPALYAAGEFDRAGGVTARKIAKWDGRSWSPLSSTVAGGNIYAMTVFDDGSGPALYAGGTFTMAGEVEAMRIAKWDGSTWSPVGGGMTGSGVFSLTVFDDGSGPALYAGGTFRTAGGVPANRIAKWDGARWSALAGGVDNSVSAMAGFDDGSGPALYVGGWFTTADGVRSNYIAKWSGCACAGDVDIDGDIDATDLSDLLSNFGIASDATRRDGDFDGDGDVDLSDLTVLLAYFGMTCP